MHNFVILNTVIKGHGTMTQSTYNVEGKNTGPPSILHLSNLKKCVLRVLDDIIVAPVGLLPRHPQFGNMATRLRVLAADDWCP